MTEVPTPRADGFRMPAEWAPHQCCFMAWPTRQSLWGELFERAKLDYAEVARAVAAFESVVMICTPGQAPEVRDHCGAAVQVTEIEIDDSWTRDNGPVFVVNDRDQVAVADFGFNAWGGKFHPYDRDAALGRALADVLGARRYVAPFVLEGGSFFVDGEGTLVTTEGPVLDPNRNPGASRDLFEQVASDYLAADKVVWLVAYPDRDTDGHIDGVAQYVQPGRLLLLVPDDPGHQNYPYALENLRRLALATDAKRRPIEALPFGVTSTAVAGNERVDIPYVNCYLANGAVVAPVAGTPSDELALARLAEVFPDRQVVGVPGRTLSYGGGGPHCITQQMPLGRAVPQPPGAVTAVETSVAMGAG
jgi:agmatine deiminase